MTDMVQSVQNWHNYLFEEVVHPISKNWFLVGSPYKLACLMLCYVYFSTKLGPKYMRNKRPYDLKNVMKYYNLAQVIISLYLFYEGVKYILSGDFNFLCQNLDDPQTPRAYRVTVMAWIYFLVKIIDLLDTVFFVLRKSERQITSLHLHHHTLMPIAGWISVTYFPGGQGVITGGINCFVHAIMYGYYFIAGLGENYKKYLWWKRHVTELQLLQFLIVGLHSSNTLFHECGFPTWIKVSVVLYAVVFFHMFGKFYYYNYIIKRKKKYDLAVEGKLVKRGKNLKNGIEKNVNGEK